MTAPAPIPHALYADAWPVYRTLGWFGTIPLPRGEKSPPPGDTTGWHAPMPSGADCQAWADDQYRGTTQLALRMPDTVIGIDVDAYGTKVGEQTITEAARRWGPLPAGPWSSARHDGVSGIRFFRIPAGVVLQTVIKFDGIADEKGYGCVEIIQHHHRYAVVWPSTNPKVAGAPYYWRGTAGPALAPHVDDLPALPTTWLEGLRSDAARADRQGSRDEANQLLAGMPDGDCPTMRRIVDGAIAELRSPGVTRHDAALAAVLRVIRAGERGHNGALAALGDLQRAYVPAVADRASAAVAEAEFDRMVYGSNGIGLVLSTPTASSDYGCKHGPQPMRYGVRLIADNGLRVDGGDDDEEGDGAGGGPGSRNLPDEFWQARTALKHIHQAAAAGWACADAVLAAMLARQASHMTPDDTVDIGLGPGPLHLFAILYGRPSAGKGVAAKVAKRTLPRPSHLDGCDYDHHPRWKERPLGSGEGLVESYFGNVDEPHPDDDTKTRRVKKQVRRSIMFTVDEGEAFTRKAQRSGTTIAQVIRSAWSGETLGESNASADRDRQLDEGTYAIGLTILFQPETIGPLFDANEVGGGTPHRFIYAAADNEQLPKQRPTETPDDPGPLRTMLTRRPPTVGFDGVKSEPKGSMRAMPPLRFRLVDEAVLDELADARWAGLRGDPIVAELDGHRSQMRGRIAAILAYWDGRTDINGEDWALAGMVLDTSDAVRDGAIAFGTRKVHEAVAAANRNYVLREVEAAEAVTVAGESRITKTAAQVARRAAKVHAADGTWSSASELRSAAGDHKGIAHEAVDYAVTVGWLVAGAGEDHGRKTGIVVWGPGPNIDELLEETED